MCFVVVQQLSDVQLLVTPWTVAHQPPLSYTLSWSLLKFMSNLCVSKGKNSKLFQRLIIAGQELFPPSSSGADPENFLSTLSILVGFPGGTGGKEPDCQCRRCQRYGFDPWVGSPGGRHGDVLQYSSLENPMGRGVWWAIVQGVAKSQTQLKQFLTYACMHSLNILS